MAEEHIYALDLLSDGENQEAHHFIQSYDDELACLIHGYLHREEGDFSNAHYWYARVGKGIPTLPIEKEFDRLYHIAKSHNA